MQKKKIWIILGIVLAVCMIAGAVIFWAVYDKTDTPEQNNSVGDGDLDEGSQYEMIEEGDVIFLEIGQSVKIASGGAFVCDKPAVASVTAEGVVTALAAGEAAITSEIDDKTVTYTVLVNKSVTKESYKAPETEETALAFAQNSVKAGEYTAVSLHLENCAGLSAFSIGFTYDSEALTLKAASGVGGTDSVQFTDDGSGNVKLIGISHSVNGICEGGIVTLYFMANEGASAGKYDLSLTMSEEDMLVLVEDGKESEAEAKLYGASIEIK